MTSPDSTTTPTPAPPPPMPCPHRRPGRSRPCRSTPARPDPATGARATPDLPDHLLRLPRHRARREPVRPAASSATSTPGSTTRPRTSSSSGSPRSRGASAARAARLRPGRRDARHPQHGPGRRPHRLRAVASTAAPTTSSTTRCPSSASRSTFVEDPDDLDAWRAAVAPEHQGVLRRDDRQPAQQRAGHRGRRGRGARGRRAADRRQHRRHAVPAAADRARRRHRRPLGHQVPRRPRHRDRRRGRRRAAPSTWRARRPVPGLHRAGPELPRPAATGRALGPLRLHRQGCACSCCATSARRSRRSTRSCCSRASRRCRCAWSGTSRTRQAVAEWLAAAATRSSRCTTRGCRPARGTSRPTGTARAAPARSSRSSSRAASRPGRRSSTR